MKILGRDEQMAQPKIGTASKSKANLLQPDKSVASKNARKRKKMK